MQNVLKILLALVLLYAGLAAIARFSSESIIFMPHPSSYKDGVDMVKVTSADGNKISALYLPNPLARYTLLVSHGNAEDLGDDRFWLEDLQHAGFSVFAYDYEGYGTSQGSPGEKVLYEDETAAYEFLTATLKIQPERVIIFGRSVGTGPAVHLAARKPAAGLVLQSPFLSAYRVLTRIPIFPFDRFPNYKDIRRVHCPVLIIHGTRDTVISPWHGKRLYQLANQPKRFLWVKGAGHNDLEMVGGEAYLEAIQDFAATLPDKHAPAFPMP